MSELEPLTITIGDHLFRVRVPGEQKAAYARAERETNERLAELVQGGAMSGPRALAMLAFELCLELDERHVEIARMRQSGERLTNLIQKIDSITARG
jgi:cell division protein ZapA (FtsZ GTPase activity inhibitor)